jgi:protein SCO1/2
MAKKKKPPEPPKEENELLRKSFKEVMGDSLKEQLDESTTAATQGAVSVLTRLRELFWYILFVCFGAAMLYILVPRIYATWLAPNPEPIHSAQLKPGAPIDRTFRLTDQNNKSVTGEKYSAVAWAVFFGFTHCPDVCPLTLSRMTNWLKALNKPERLQVFFISVDPERDTPEVLADYMKAFDPRIEALTGPDVLIKQVINNFHVYAKKVAEPGETNYSMDHTANVILLRSDGLFMGTIDGDEPDNIAIGKLKQLIGDTP